MKTFLNTLQHNKFAALSFSLLLLCLLWIPCILVAPAINPISELSLWLYSIMDERWLTGIAFLLTFLNAVLLFYINNRHLVFPSNGFLLSLLYILIASTVPAIQWFSGAQVAVLFILIGTNYLFALPQRFPGIAELFVAGFFYAIAAICFPPAIFVLLLVPIALLTLHAAWRSWVVFLASVLLPFVYLLLYNWLTTGDIGLSIEKLHMLLPVLPLQLPDIGMPIVLFFGCILLIVLLSFGNGFLLRAGVKAQSTFIRAMFSWMLVLFVVGVFFYPAYNSQLLPLIALPAAGIATGYLGQQGGRKTKVFCWVLLIASAVYLQVADFL